jgi:hypothetical protein
MKAIITYIDLKRTNRAAFENDSGEPPPDPIWYYLPLAAGVEAGPFIHDYICGRLFNLGWSDAGLRMILGLLFAFMLFPTIYRNAFDPERSFVVQALVVFTLGLGWQSLFLSILRGAG